MILYSKIKASIVIIADRTFKESWLHVLEIICRLCLQFTEGMLTSVPLGCPWETACKGWSMTQCQQQALKKNKKRKRKHMPFQTFHLLPKYTLFIF